MERERKSGKLLKTRWLRGYGKRQKNTHNPNVTNNNPFDRSDKERSRGGDKNALRWAEKCTPLVRTNRESVSTTSIDQLQRRQSSLFPAPPSPERRLTLAALCFFSKRMRKIADARPQPQNTALSGVVKWKREGRATGEEGRWRMVTVGSRRHHHSFCHMHCFVAGL